MVGAGLAQQVNKEHRKVLAQLKRQDRQWDGMHKDYEHLWPPQLTGVQAVRAAFVATPQFGVVSANEEYYKNGAEKKENAKFVQACNLPQYSSNGEVLGFYHANPKDTEYVHGAFTLFMPQSFARDEPYKIAPVKPLINGEDHAILGIYANARESLMERVRKGLRKYVGGRDQHRGMGFQAEKYPLRLPLVSKGRFDHELWFMLGALDSAFLAYANVELGDCALEFGTWENRGGSEAPGYAITHRLSDKRHNILTTAITTGADCNTAQEVINNILRSKHWEYRNPHIVPQNID